MNTPMLCVSVLVTRMSILWSLFRSPTATDCGCELEISELFDVLSKICRQILSKTININRMTFASAIGFMS